MPENNVELLEKYYAFTYTGTSRTIICVDDRPLEDPAQVFPPNTGAHEQTYVKIAGGTSGANTDRLLVLESLAPDYLQNSAISKSNHARLLAKRFAAAGFWIYNHVSCRAHEADYLVLAGMHDKVKDHADELEEIIPGTRKSQYFKVAEAAGRIALQIEGAEPSGELKIMESSDKDLPGMPVKTVKLADANHASDTLIFSLNENELFDTAAAFEEGAPAYFASPMTLLEAHNVSDLVKLPVPMYKAATGLRHFVIAKYGLQSPLGEPLNFVVKDTA